MSFRIFLGNNRSDVVGAAGRLAATEEQDIALAYGAAHRTKLFYLKNANHSGGAGLSLQDGIPPTISTIQTTTGWEVGTGNVGRFCAMNAGTEVDSASAGYVSSWAVPLAALADDCLRTENKYTGDFLSNAFSLRFGHMANTADLDGTIRFYARLWSSPNADGSGATQWSSGLGSASFGSDNAVTATITWTVTATAQIKLRDEYLFVQVACYVQSASSTAFADVRIVVGSGGGVQAAVTTPLFVPAEYGTFAATEEQDVALANGAVALPVQGTLVATEAQDNAAFGGNAVRAGTMSVTEVGDGLIAYGHHTHLGAMSAVEAQDTFAATGNSARHGTFAATEAQDVALLFNPHNLFYYSEQTDDTSRWYHWWQAVITANATTDSVGALTAERHSEPALTDFFFVAQNIVPFQGQIKRLWVEAKASGRNYLRGWSWGGASEDGSQQTFNLSTGIASGSLNPTMEDLGNGWWLCSFNVPSQNQTLGFGPWNGDGSTTSAPYPGDGSSGIYVARVRLTYGTTKLQYTKTTDTIFDVPKGVVVAGTLTPTEAQDVVASSGSVTPNHFGTLAATESQDTLAASGSAFKLTTGTFAATEAQDDFDAVGTDSGVGVMAVVEAQDVAAFVGSHTHLGTFAATDGQDVFAGAAQIVRRTGTLSVVETQDVAALAGQTGHAGTLSAVEATDSFVSGGYVFQIGATLAATEAQDIAVFVGVTLDLTGTLVATEAQDAFAGAGLLYGIRYGTLVVTESPDAFYAGGYTYRPPIETVVLASRAHAQRLKATARPAGRRAM